MIYLFNNNLLFKTILKAPKSAVMRRKINSANELNVEETAKKRNLLDNIDIVGHFFKKKFYLYKLRGVGIQNNRMSIQGIDLAWDLMAKGPVIKDRRLSNVSCLDAFKAALDPLGFVPGSVETTSPASVSYYYLSPLEAIKKAVEVFNVEPVFYFEFDGKDITAMKYDIIKKRGRLTGETYIYGSNLLEVKHEETRDNIISAVYPRGKGEEVKDESGQVTAYTRRLTIADAVWSTSKGDPLDKPFGQEFLEKPKASGMFGYKGMRREVVKEFPDTTDPYVLIGEGFQFLEQNSMPIVTFEGTVAKAGPYELGDTNYIFRPDLGLKYAARIFEDQVDLLRPSQTKFLFGDYVESGAVKRAREAQKALDDLKTAILDEMHKISTTQPDLSAINAKIDEMWDDITGANGGNVITFTNPDGTPYAWALTDNAAVDQVQEYIYLSNQGISFGKTGLSNPPELAIGINGEIAGGSAFFQSLMTNLIQSDIGSKLDLRSNKGITLMVTAETQSYIDANKDQLKGADGNSVHRMYSPRPDGTDYMGAEPSINWAETYIGIYSGPSLTAPTDPALYTWSKFSPDDPPIYYRHEMFADDINGTNMSQNSSGKKFRGEYWDFTEEDSTDPKKYQWYQYVAEDGAPAPEWTIGSDGYWYQDGVKTDKIAVGKADVWTIGSDGYWYKNGTKTSTLAQGTKGDPGSPGKSPSIRYSDSPDGADMSLVDNGQKYVGIAPPDKDPSLPGSYSWIPRAEFQEVIGSVNLIRIDELKAINGAIVDTSDYLTNGRVDIKNGTSTQSGLVFTVPAVRPNSYYVISFSLSKIPGVTGVIQQIGGLTGPTWSDNEVYLDGVLQPNKWSSPTRVQIDTGGTQYVEIKFKTGATVNPLDTIAIMPNFGLTVQTGIRLMSFMLTDGTKTPSEFAPSALDGFRQRYAQMTKNGFEVAGEGEGTKSTMEPDGFRVKAVETGENVFAATTAGVEGKYGFFQEVRAENLSERLKPGIYACYVDGKYASGDFSGRDWNNRAGTIRDALNYIMGQAKELTDCIIDVYLRNTTSESLVLRDLKGGLIRIQGYSLTSRFVGSISIQKCLTKVQIQSFTGQRPPESTQDFISNIASLGVEVTGVQMDGSGGGTLLGAYDGGTTLSKGNIMANATYAHNASSNGHIHIEDCKGSGCTYASNCDHGGIISLQGTRPVGTVREGVGGIVKDGKTGALSVPTADPFSLVAPSFATVSRIFKAELERYNKDSNYTTPGAFAQGTSPTNGNTYIGRAKFGDRISSWLKDNGGYTNLQSFVITIKRGTWGYGADPLKITSPNTMTGPAQERGTTVTKTIDAATYPDLFKAIETSADLTLLTSTILQDDYADFLEISIKVIADKKV